MSEQEYNCWNCGNKTTKRRIPYGSKRKTFWCSVCDKDLVNVTDKKHARRDAKKEIEKQRSEDSE